MTDFVPYIVAREQLGADRDAARERIEHWRDLMRLSNRCHVSLTLHQHDAAVLHAILSLTLQMFDRVPPEGILTEAAARDAWKARGVNTRTANALAEYKIWTVAQLQAMTEAEFLRLPNCGRVGLAEITDLFGYLGMLS